MYVWRIPVLMLAPLVVTVLLLVFAAGVLAWRRSAPNPVARAVLLAAVILAHLASPALVSAVIEWFIAREPATAKYLDPSFVLMWLPAGIVPLLLFMAHQLFPFASAARGSVLRYRVAFYGSAVVFAILNVVNWCSPGWCERFGFPLPYSWWSDAIMVINGENLTAGFAIGALFINLAVLAVLTLALSRLCRRQSAT